MKKTLLRIVLVVSLCLLCLQAGALADTVEVTTEAELKTAISATTYTERTIVLKNDITLTAALPMNTRGELTICSDSSSNRNYVLTAASEARHFKTSTSSISNGVSLTFESITLDGVNAGGGIEYASGFSTNSTGTYTLTLGKDVIIEKCYAAYGNANSSEGGGLSIYTTDTNGQMIVNINGAVIRNNTSFRQRTTSAYLMNNDGGGGIHAYGRIITINMTDGSIEGNVAQAGGGVKLASGATMNMSGGVIQGNSFSTSRNRGGGVYVYNNTTTSFRSTFNMSGGTIKENAGAFGAAARAFGGGVCVEGGQFTMTNGVIENNGGWYTSATDKTRRIPESNDFLGGGVALGKDAVFDMQGGVIRDNLAVSGGGVCLGISSAGDDMTMTMSGDSLITRNHAQKSRDQYVGSGGGIGSYNNPTAVVTMSGNSSINNNTAAGYGAGVSFSCSDEDANGDGVKDALFTMAGNSSIHHNAVSGSGTTLAGGGIYASSNVTMKENSAVYENTVAGGLNNDGGGMDIHNNGILTMQDNARIYRNTATSGGGLHVNNRANAILQDKASIDNNTASKNGGGIYIAYDAAGTDNPTTVTAGAGVEIKNNTAQNGDGGGVYLNAYASILDWIHFTTTGKVNIVNNQAPNGNGGGIYCPAEYDKYYANTDDNKTLKGYWNDVLTLDDETTFTGNVAKKSYLPPADYNTAYPNIQFASISLPTLNPYHPLNNYDINFEGRSVVYKPVTFKVVNGTWENGTTTDITVQIQLVNNVGDLSAYIPVGMLPNDGFDPTGYWDVMPPTTVQGTDTAVYTYIFVEKPQGVTLPETGDESNIQLYILVGMLALLGIWALLMKGKVKE